MLTKLIWEWWWKRINQWLNPKLINKNDGLRMEQTKYIKLNIQWTLHGIEWNEYVELMLRLLFLDFDKISENGRNICEWNQINQTILEIDFDRTFTNEYDRSTFWRLEISKCHQYSIFRNTFQCHWTRVIETQPFRSYGC